VGPKTALAVETRGFVALETRLAVKKTRLVVENGGFGLGATNDEGGAPR
jgi:hypothetical protein